MSGNKNSKGRGGPGSKPVKGAKPAQNIVSAARTTQSNRGTLIAGMAVLVVLAIVIGGVVYNRSQNAELNAGYGSAKNAAVSIDEGVILVGDPAATTTLDIYEDPMCPNCAQFESRFGSQIAQALDEGQFALRYRTLDFLNQQSASGDYSTRASGAMMCVASDGDGTAFPEFHASLFTPENQPGEGAGTDHSNEELAEFAGDAGASDAAQECVASGGRTDAAKTESEEAQAQLEADGQQVSTPSVINDGTKIDTTNENWVSEVSAS